MWKVGSMVYEYHKIWIGKIISRTWWRLELIHMGMWFWESMHLGRIFGHFSGVFVPNRIYHIKGSAHTYSIIWFVVVNCTSNISLIIPFGCSEIVWCETWIQNHFSPDDPLCCNCFFYFHPWHKTTLTIINRTFATIILFKKWKQY